MSSVMTPAARLQAAIDILGEIEGTAKPVERLLRDWGRAHRFAGSKDRAAIAERIYRVLRHRSTFAWRMGSDNSRALAIASVLEEGEVETLFAGQGYGPAPLSEAERAAVAAPSTGEAPLHVQGEYPAFLEDELKRAFGERLLDEMTALQQRAPVDLRVNSLRADRDEVLAALRDAGYAAVPTRRSALGIRLEPGVTGLERTALFESGAFEFQDEAAQLAALLCEARPGQRVLDLAAGAGGKSLALAAMMENEGEIVAEDVRETALEELERRAVRAGVSIIRRLPRPHEAGDAERQRVPLRDPLTPALFPGGGEGVSFDLFDIVLLDSPCSGTGTWRRQPELRWRLTPERLSELMATQDTLLDRAAARVKPGGRLVYATCSVLPCENEDRVGALLKSRHDFVLRPAHDAWLAAIGTKPPSGTKDAFRASPYSIGTDGFFAAIVERIA
jgi:16S rRNA (cytosine967-C5)-methyltransferase